MNPCQVKSRKLNRKLMKSRKSNGWVEFLPEKVIAQVLSNLPVKYLMQLRCVCKAWNTLLSHPSFIKLHLQQSKQNTPQILCISQDFSILPLPLHTLLNNPSIIKSTKNCFPLPSNPDYFYQFIGSCNGLFCFLVIELNHSTNNWFQLWNPATNLLSNKFGHHICNHSFIYGFSFGYDNSTDTYTTLNFRHHQLEIFSSRSNVVGKIIQLPGMSPLFCWHLDPVPYKYKFFIYDVYLNGTVNLLARDNAKQILIISFNLATHTYTKLLPPQDFVAVSLHLPTIHVFQDSLYFSHHTQKTHFIIWKMMEFGIQNSWTQFLRIRYTDLDIHRTHRHFLVPLCLYDSGIVLVQGAKDARLQVIVYNSSENRIEKTRMHKQIKWIFNQNYVESMVPVPTT